jgi:cysteine desulfurase
MASLRARMIEGARTLVPSLRLNGDPERSAPHILSLGFPGVPGEPLLHALERHGVYVSAGSACAAKDKKPSGVLRAIGVPDDVGVIRVSFSRFSTEAEVDRALAALGSALAELG